MKFSLHKRAAFNPSISFYNTIIIKECLIVRCCKFMVTYNYDSSYCSAYSFVLHEGHGGLRGDRGVQSTQIFIFMWNFEQIIGVRHLRVSNV